MMYAFPTPTYFFEEVQPSFAGENAAKMSTYNTAIEGDWPDEPRRVSYAGGGVVATWISLPGAACAETEEIATVVHGLEGGTST
ncbi:hypothetical protein PC116_g16244 [Phytophthora cactorum]|uniref:Uncharacterized protein n=1 Tax=Phytophthora cactorum TaxID=29920 RepID=A0A8T1EDP7_9STRA|nr:hypothetical protein Pcac1_g5586 [Phytophthora cactorum]KAG2918555.1 hypothetical protein PC114_g6760 [Phytophthora cactorum]KAG2952374.1 hypothetical protein PC117_g2838 [Phytophthora cactorum]KAG2996523.1 hypothetical protein PC120_g21481 [Phytophthora cactorum]KAG3034561.1 hypothetical protein PC119_g4871 [Phytophthora cactorum]